jgi:hypothetical protein
MFQPGAFEGRRPCPTPSSLQEGDPLRKLARQPEDGGLGQDEGGDGREGVEGTAGALQVETSHNFCFFLRR